ncbi:threonine transporter RhtB [Longimycelium tulufanense]|uniref:Threonine transporter RhtB n=1 Tax=Longimycelium tulufanense TaxID=907463 RepID=A0A8J3CKP1_9PSEU|nr:LysE family translocator [Longimycelium tulufanense]GGM77952.1 threonine transporter RhtB [Longimycelium tulufanense]
MTEILLAFAALSLLLAVAPGPDILLVLRSTVKAGWRAGVLTAVGAAVGSMWWAVAAAVGLAAVLQTWSVGYTVIRVAGALYLVSLGVQALVRRAVEQAPAQPEPEPGAMDRWRAWRAGFLSAMLNPKIGLFFLAVVPQFLPHDQPVAAMTLLFGAVDAVVALVWLTLVAVAAGRLMRWLSRPRVGSALDRCTGVALTGLGVATLASQ